MFENTGGGHGSPLPTPMLLASNFWQCNQDTEPELH